MNYKDDYNELREAFLDFKKKKYFEMFSSADIFLVEDEDMHVLLTFIEQFFGESYGLQCFFNRDGLNYVHDVLSASDEYAVTVGDCDSIVAVFKKKKDLTLEDIKFLDKVGKKRVPDNNLILYRFKKGYHYTIANPKEISIMALYGVFLASLISNEKEMLLEAFREDNCVLCELNKKKYEYSCMYRSVPFLEVNPKKSARNQPFVDEYKDKPYINDECYLYTSYLPVSVSETGVRPLLLYFYFVKSGAMQLKYIIEPPKEYKNIIYGILDDVFMNIGMPAKMTINNRDIFYILTKTLDALHIENEFERNNLKAGESVSVLISKLYSQTQDGQMESSETITMLMDLISDAINTLDDEESLDDVLEDNPKKEDFVS